MKLQNLIQRIFNPMIHSQIQKNKKNIKKDLEIILKVIIFATHFE